MAVRTQSRNPRGLPAHVAGTWRRGGARPLDDDLAAPARSATPAVRRRGRTPADDERAQEYKDRIERLAREGRHEEAADLARRCGALQAGDPMPYGEGTGAWWDGRRLRTIMFHGYDVEMLDEFHPESISPPDGM